MKRKLSSELDRSMVIAYIQRLDIKAKLYTVEALEKKANRSISQNSLMWLWLTCIGFETGNDPDVLHEFFKEKYLEPKEIIIFNSKVKKYTTTNLNTVQFKNYLDKIQVFSLSELSIILPNPEDKYWEEFLNYYQDKL